MAELEYLRDLIVILAAAVLVVTILHRLRIPAIAGFILAGVLVGPHALRLVNDLHQVEVLAEIGVALLLFGIGLELSLERVKRLWRPVLLGGTIQVGLTILAALGLARLLGQPLPAALLLGFIIAVSSTAIVLRGLDTRGELEAPHGRLTLGILVFQDLCVVPMILVIPLLGQSGPPQANLTGGLITAVVAIVVVMLIGKTAVPWILRLVARTRQRHLFVLSVVLASLGIAWVISTFGVSLALGAFIAGLIVSGCEFRHQALADLIPFREVFTSVFFVSVGMLLNLAEISTNLVPILALTAAIIVGKFLIVLLTGLALRLSATVSVVAAAALSQVGEFSFVLERAALPYGLVAPSVMSSILTAAIFTMILTPFALALGPHLAAGVGKVRRFSKWLQVRTAEDTVQTAQRLQDHVIIGGYGFTGQILARALQDCRIPYLIVDINSENVRQALDESRPACYGDITSLEVLQRLGVQRASELVLAVNNPQAAERAVKAARNLAPGIHITVRSHYLLDVASADAAGADEVIPAEREAAVETVARVLKRRCVDSRLAATEIQKVRASGDTGE